MDQAEQLAIDRAKELFNCSFVNVQPHAGAQANQAVFLALLNPGDTFMGMRLDCGGHLTHGSPVNMSGKWFKPVGYGVNAETGLIEMDEVRALAREHRPKLIVAGGSAYPRIIDFAAFRAIADEIGAVLMVDMAHFAGLVAGGAYPSPLPHAHIVTTTTHKTLRGPRGGMILSADDAFAKSLNSAVFPGNQGGPLMHIIAAKAVAFKEALDPNFKTYAHQVVKNAQALSLSLSQAGYDLVSGGTDSHLVLVDLRKKGITGHDASEALEHAGITCNKNGTPQDPLPPSKTSGIRLGSPACTTRGLMEADFALIGRHTANVLDGLIKGDTSTATKEAQKFVTEMAARYPLYPGLSY